ncbi:MAG TPA: imelysin family protein [Microthrixaceae bacterium]|nr:imelysin family protein [Microthrixaceae bacterium]
MIVGALAVALVLVGCSDDDPDAGSTTSAGATDDRATVQRQLADDVISTTYLDAARATEVARDEAAAACAVPTAESVEQARSAVVQALGVWESLDPIDFGPVMTLRADRFVSYPAATDKIDERLGDPPPDEGAATTRLASDARGLGAAAYLLDAPPAAFADPARCTYLTSIMAAAATRVEEVRAAWFDDPTPYLEYTAGRGDESMVSKELIDTVVNMSVDVLGADLKALGSEPADPEVTRATIAAHAATIEALWGAGESGLSTLVDDVLAERLRGELDQLVKATAESPLDTEAVTAATEAVRATLGADVVGALDVTVGFSENDGDS